MKISKPSRDARLHICTRRLKIHLTKHGCFLPIVLCLTVLFSLHQPTCLAITNANVLVLYNPAIPDSVQIANYYAQKRPGVRLLALEGVPAVEEITQDIYLSLIRPQVLSALDSTVDVIVTTKGLPLRIYNTQAPQSFPYTYTDPEGVQRIIYATSYKRYSSLESELTRIDKISTWQQMGDQTWWYPIGPPNPSRNPYYRREAAFSYSDPANGQMRLTARLDGFTLADALASIDRAQNVFVVPAGHRIIVDDSPAAVAHGSTAMQALVENVLMPRGQSYLYDQQIAPVLTSSKPVIGYVSHGTNDGSGQLQPTYMRTQLSFQLVNGAIAHTWESFNGYSFIEGNNRGQALIGDWLRAGGTAGVATVEEPGGNLYCVANEDRLFEMMLNGFTWAEAAWNATQQLSYVNTVIGDPLMVWSPWLPGDANLDGMVDNNDFGALFSHFNMTGSVTFADGDFDFDGDVDNADFGVFFANFGASSTAASMPRSSGNDVPEPLPGILPILWLGLLVRRARQSNSQTESCR